MAEDGERRKGEMRAFITNASRNVVFLQTLSPSNTASVGTGVLVRHSGHFYIVSALHNLVFNEGHLERAQHATRFKFGCGEDDLRILGVGTPAPPDTPLDFGTVLPLKPQPLIDKKLDLVALRIEDGYEPPKTISAFDLETNTFYGDLQKGASILIIGNPWDGRQTLGNGKEVLMPYFDYVDYDPDAEFSGLSYQFNSKDHILFRYALSRERIKPHGFSGAPVWKHEETGGIVWASNPRIVGIVLRYVEARSLLIAVKVHHVLRLLQTERTERQARVRDT
jgi:hypothetical protein